MPEAGETRDSSREWFREWFGAEYLELYPHRDETEAGHAVRLFLAVAPPSTGPVLDLACGAGRHLRELEAAGVSAVGLDLSGVLLGEARAASDSARLVRADMRELPFRPESFGGLTSFFTSFGYFRSRQEDRRVVSQARAVLRPGASFMLDFLNEARVRANLVARDERDVGGRRVVQTRRIEGDTVVKKISIDALDEGGEGRGFEERVRLYAADELVAILGEEGLRVTGMFGDYHGADSGPSAERLIIVGSAA